MRITRRVEFDAAHRLPNHAGKCRRLHGHRYVVDVTVSGPIRGDLSSSTGMVVDFTDLDVILKHVIVDRYDHRTILFSTDPLAGILGLNPEYGVVVVEFMPTAERLAQAIYDELEPLAGNLGDGVNVVEVTVWETPRSSATAAGAFPAARFSG